MWKVLIVAVLAVCWSIPAFACDCSSETASIPAQSSQLEVWGEATKVVRSATGHLVRFDVHAVLYDKDSARPTEIVVQDPKYCGVDFKEGESYFVRGMKMRTGETLYLTNSCAGSGPIAAPPKTVQRAQAKLEKIESDDEAALERAVAKAAEACREEDSPAFESFLLIAAPQDDPLIIETTASIKTKRTSCISHQMLDSVRKLAPEQPMLVSGTALLKGRARGHIDVWKCASECDTFSKRMQARLMQVTPPLTEHQARTLAKQMHNVADRDPSIEIARTLCRLDGVEAAEKFALNNKLVGGPRWDAELQAMLFECSLAARKLDQARTLLQTTNPGPAFSIAFEWATRSDQLSLPIRRDEPTLKATLDDQSLASVRQSFANTELWENDPLMLEAFAESVAGDPDAPAAVRKLGALAYHKAGLLHPSASEPYTALARELVSDEELGEALATLRANHQQAMSANDARASLAERAAAEEVDQLDLDASTNNQTNQANTRRAPILKDEPDDGLDLDWGSLAVHLLVVVGSLSFVAFLASRGSRRR